jgi:biotin operon repressor
MSNKASKLYDEIGQFTAIPDSVIEMWPSIGVDAMALFVHLRYRTNKDSKAAFPSYSTISQETGLTRRRIALAIRSLESNGLIERQKRFGRSTVYTLKLPKPDSSTDPGLLDETPPVVQGVDQSSTDPGLSVVQGVHTNQIDLNQIDPNQIKKRAAKPPARSRPDKASDPLLKHPAVVLYRNTMRLTPNEVQRQAIAETVGEEQDQLLLYGATLKSWMEHGWKPTNVADQLDCFRNGHRSKYAANRKDKADGSHLQSNQRATGDNPAERERLQQLADTINARRREKQASASSYS